MNRFKHALVALFIAFSSATMLFPAAVSAASFTQDACGGASSVDANACTAGSGTALTNIVKFVVNILSIVVASAAVIMIIMSGFKYVTSAGDSNNISSAKNTLIYAIVGLFIVAIAQFIVRFVLTKAHSAVNTP